MIAAYLLLGCAIVMEVLGSSMLKLSEGFKRLLPSIGVIVGYSVAFYLFSIALKQLPLGVSYATWSGVGTVLTVLVGVYMFKEKINRKTIIGLVLLLVGIILLNLQK
ncbi:multidrug efflux SMR transporter [Paenibacillus sp. J5C_2022]|uniref:DMT family transporter n=1 Tax=Paenibacillus sp. J5C2022 TaxID=2977129 RepID=UPI0021D291CE|nr:multidrug efflux SMR transporter [Paenibacillus sp. J5C2022]MCU6709266.1 multidrug efflux SMR transporter [Paenibacillus sp. J5C2022]